MYEVLRKPSAVEYFYKYVFFTTKTNDISFSHFHHPYPTPIRKKKQNKNKSLYLSNSAILSLNRPSIGSPFLISMNDFFLLPYHIFHPSSKKPKKNFFFKNHNQILIHLNYRNKMRA